jgi:HEAT repeat protein
MMGLLADSDDAVREDAAIALGSWKEPAIDRLVNAFDSDQQAFRNAASQALGLMGAEAVPRLVDLLGNPRPPVRYSAASALGDIGRPAKVAREPLEKLASTDPDQSVRYYARTALVRIQR